jgi:hypothetical protein
MTFRRSRSPLIKPPPGSRVDWTDPSTKGLTNCWLFNEGAGRIVADICNKSKPAAFSGTPVWSPGIFGSYCVDLDGSTAMISTPVTLGVGAFSISLWFRHDAAGTDIIFSQDIGGNDTALIYSTTNTEWAYQNDNFVGATAQNASWDYTRDALWHHMCFVEPFDTDAVNAQLYIDGVLKAQGGTDAGSNPAASNLTLGGRLGGTTAWEGALDNVRLYRGRAITHAEVIRLYNEPFAGIIAPRRHIRAAVAAGGGFQAAWARGANFVHQPGRA